LQRLRHGRPRSSSSRNQTVVGPAPAGASQPPAEKSRRAPDQIRGKSIEIRRVGETAYIKGSGQVSFSDFGKPVPVSAPAADLVIDVSKLGG
jgi:hypothetical protein